jgi:hypothetical protein
MCERFSELLPAFLAGQRRFASKEIKAEKKRHELLLRRMQVGRIDTPLTPQPQCLPLLQVPVSFVSFESVGLDPELEVAALLIFCCRFQAVLSSCKGTGVTGTPRQRSKRTCTLTTSWKRMTRCVCFGNVAAVWAASSSVYAFFYIRFMFCSMFNPRCKMGSPP